MPVLRLIKGYFLGRNYFTCLFQQFFHEREDLDLGIMTSKSDKPSSNSEQKHRENIQLRCHLAQVSKSTATQQKGVTV